MRKIFVLLAMVSTAAFTGCTINDDQPDVITNNYTLKAEMFELTNVDFDASANFRALYDLGAPIHPADMILVYRLKEVFQGNDVWELIPRTYYFDDEQELDYDYNFTRNDIELYLDFTNGLDLNAIPEFTQNQIFRIVIIPGYDNTARMDFTNYDAVIKTFGISEENIKRLN